MTAIEPRPELALADVGGLGAAAERFARLSLRSSPQTQRTYRSTYNRFALWLADYNGGPAGPEAFTADALADFLDAREQDAAAATVKKERAALNKLAKYLHTIGAIDATEVLMVAGPRPAKGDGQTRDALEADVWKRVKQVARGREAGAASGRASRAAAVRDTAVVVLLGEAGLRNEELRRLRRDDVFARHSDGTRPWLRVHGKGSKRRDFPLRAEAVDALTRWERARPRELEDEPLLLPRLGRRRVDGAFPDAGGQLSGKGLTAIVKPIMRAAGVPDELCHPHVLRHTFGSLWMAHGGELSQLQTFMGHASPSTTAQYVHHTAQQQERASLAQERGPGVLAAHAASRGRLAGQLDVDEVLDLQDR